MRKFLANSPSVRRSLSISIVFYHSFHRAISRPRIVHGHHGYTVGQSYESRNKTEVVLSSVVDQWRFLSADLGLVRSFRAEEPWWKHSFELLKVVHLNLDWQLISFHNLLQLKFGSFDFVLLDLRQSKRASTAAMTMGNGSTCCGRIFSIDFEIDHPKMHKISDSLLDAAKCILVNIIGKIRIVWYLNNLHVIKCSQIKANVLAWFECSSIY